MPIPSTMESKGNMKAFSRFWLLAFATALSLSAAEAAQPKWSFVVMGDTRDLTTDTLTGISPDLALLAQAIAAEKPDLVLHTGDLINGYYTSKSSPMTGKYREMLENWKAAIRPVYDFDTKKGIPLYVIRGNHEDGKFMTESALKKAYEEKIGAFMPQNGPENEKGLTYSVTHKGARFVALDAYSTKILKVIRGYVNESWAESHLASGNAAFTFVFSHPPAFRVGTSGKSPFPDLYSHTTSRDVLWKSMKKAGALAFFCGHIHLYCRGTVKGIEQVVVGNGGANTVSYDPKETDPLIAMHYPTSNVAATQIKTGYLLMTVDESTGTTSGVQKLWNPETRAWETGDNFILATTPNRSES